MPCVEEKIMLKSSDHLQEYNLTKRIRYAGINLKKKQKEKKTSPFMTLQQGIIMKRKFCRTSYRSQLLELELGLGFCDSNIYTFSCDDYACSNVFELKNFIFIITSNPITCCDSYHV